MDISGASKICDNYTAVFSLGVQAANAVREAPPSADSRSDGRPRAAGLNAPLGLVARFFTLQLKCHRRSAGPEVTRMRRRRFGTTQCSK